MSELVDIGALLTVAAIAFAGGVGVVALFSVGLVNATAVADHRNTDHRNTDPRKPDHPDADHGGGRRNGAVVTVYAAVAGVSLLVCACVIVLGVWAMLDK